MNEGAEYRAESKLMVEVGWGHEEAGEWWSIGVTCLGGSVQSLLTRQGKKDRGSVLKKL